MKLVYAIVIVDFERMQGVLPLCKYFSLLGNNQHLWVGVDEISARKNTDCSIDTFYRVRAFHGGRFCAVAAQVADGAIQAAGLRIIAYRKCRETHPIFTMVA